MVDVSAFRFGWIFEYMDPGSLDAETGTYEPEGITISGGGREGAPEMTLPVGEPVLIRLTAADVIHSWYVPAFFFKRDAIPGRVNEFELTIEKPGVYGGQCAEFCGLAHGDMYFSVNAIAADEYDAWVAEPFKEDLPRLLVEVLILVPEIPDQAEHQAETDDRQGHPRPAPYGCLLVADWYEHRPVRSL